MKVYCCTDEYPHILTFVSACLDIDRGSENMVVVANVHHIRKYCLQLPATGTRIY